MCITEKITLIRSEVHFFWPPGPYVSKLGKPGKNLSINSARATKKSRESERVKNSKKKTD